MKCNYISSGALKDIAPTGWDTVRQYGLC